MNFLCHDAKQKTEIELSFQCSGLLPLNIFEEPINANVPVEEK